MPAHELFGMFKRMTVSAVAPKAKYPRNPTNMARKTSIIKKRMLTIGKNSFGLFASEYILSIC